MQRRASRPAMGLAFGRMRGWLAVCAAVALVLALTLAPTGGTAHAEQGPEHGLRIDRGPQLPRACNGHGAQLLVHVQFTLRNDYDSGFGGNAWANDTIHRSMQVWHEADGTFCAVVMDRGSFVTFAGESPNKTGTVEAGIRGEMQGGYVATIPATATVNPTPAYRTHGELGTFDLQCDPSFHCPGPHPSFTSYLDGTAGYALPSWGWIYRTARNGTWVNASAGSSGDITGAAPAAWHPEHETHR